MKASGPGPDSKEPKGCHGHIWA